VIDQIVLDALLFEICPERQGDGHRLTKAEWTSHVEVCLRGVTSQCVAVFYHTTRTLALPLFDAEGAVLPRRGAAMKMVCRTQACCIGNR
jgi:hypothetical protein